MRALTIRQPWATLVRALTIRQPWATLIALGVKTIETRSWRAPASLIGQHFAIHAGAKVPEVGHLGEWCIDWTRRDGPWMRRHTLDPSIRLPLGAIVATARLVGSVPAENLINEDTARVPEPWGFQHYICRLRDQLPYGDFTPGRWAWLLDDVKPTTDRCPWCENGGSMPTPCPVCADVGGCPPIPAKGRQGLWGWEP